MLLICTNNKILSIRQHEKANMKKTVSNQTETTAQICLEIKKTKKEKPHNVLNIQYYVDIHVLQKMNLILYEIKAGMKL